MRIQNLRLKNFKRFTDLSIEGIPDNTRLVLLIGSNGSGKSSIFDAFEVISRSTKGRKGVNLNVDLIAYYRKKLTEPFQINLYADGLNFRYSETSGNQDRHFPANAFYGRSSFRQVPILTRKNLGQVTFDFEKDDDRPALFIDRDTRFENDIEKLSGSILEAVFKTDQDTRAIRERYIDPINTALANIFGTESATALRLINMSPPLEGKVARLIFQKGDSEFHYNQLSAGEKEIFNVLLNLIARKDHFQDTVYFYDEIDLHLNTKIQYAFIKEIIENWLPDQCQLWTASHSLGFIEYATEYEKGSVIDFDDLNFDIPQILTPKLKDQFEIFEIAVSKAFIDKVVQGRKIVFSENQNTPVFNDLNLENTFFFVGIDKSDVFHKAKNHKQFGLIDRDYLTDDEIIQLRKIYPNIYILPYYSFENLLYHPDNIEEYSLRRKKDFDKILYIQKLTDIKNDKKDYILTGVVQARSGYPFYKENERAKELRSFRDGYKNIIELLRSNNFEDFYKVFPMKTYAKELEERQNVNPADLAKTSYFKQQIESALNQ